MTDNMILWDALSKTDPKATKPFKRAGGFSGTAVKPIWIVKRLTEQFGACGMGWGMDEPSFQVVPVGDGEMLVYCTVRCWASSQDKYFYGVGGDKIVAKRKDGSSFNDDEAFKKAFTDAVGNAFKFIGVAADIHMGQFDDSKYVREMEQEFAEPKAEQPKKQPPLKGPIKTRAELRDACGVFVRDLHACSDENMLYGCLTDNKKLIDQVEAEAPFFWNGDGADFRGMAGEIEDAKKRVTDGNEWRDNPLNGG